MGNRETRLWTKNFTLLTLASAIGSAGGIAGSFALSFFVFDETGSTLASSLVIAVQLIPHVIVPLFAAPLMDRLPRKAFLVGGDLGSGLIYAAMGYWLLTRKFSYIGYLLISMILAVIASIDHLAYSAMYPSVINEGAEQKGYAVASMLYPILNVVMTPLGAVLLDTIGVPMLLLIQGGMAIAAGITESFISDVSEPTAGVKGYGVKDWIGDLKEAVDYLKKEKGLRSIFEYVAFASGITRGYNPLLVAFFRTMPGLSAAMYSLFSAADFLGRTAAGALQYSVKISKEKRHKAHTLFCLGSDLMNMTLLWLPYPLMLVNRALGGFLENNKGILRSAAVQLYIPENLRARINGFNNTVVTALGSVLALVVGAAGEIMDYRLCVTVLSAVSILCCWLLTVRKEREADKVFSAE
ncbi:MAG: MFS transporter [Firmicutes bacterium]|nr:MFS transporter [Bacillota bacterium]